MNNTSSHKNIMKNRVGMMLYPFRNRIHAHGKLGSLISGVLKMEELSRNQLHL